MNSISNETPSAFMLEDGTPKQKQVQARIPVEHGSFEELDIIDVMAFLWHARQYIVGGMIMGALLGLTYSASRKHPEPVVAAPEAVSASLVANYRNEFLLLGKNDPLDSESSDRIKKFSELFSQPQVLRIFFETITSKWPETTEKWAGPEKQEFSGSFEDFLARQRAESLISLSAAATPQHILMRLTLKLPITVDSQELTEVMTGIVDRINSSIILPMDRRATTANQQTMEEIQWLKVEQMKQKSRLNKLYYSLWKVSDADRLGAVSPVALNSNGQSEAISLDQVLALIGKLTTENLIDAKQETKYYQELVDIQTKLEELPRQINKRSSMLSQVLLKPIALDLSRKHGVVVSNAETLPSKAETSQTQVQGTTPAPPIPPIRSPGFFVILGLMFGLFSGLTVAAIKFFLEKNWDLIKARVNA